MRAGSADPEEGPDRPSQDRGHPDRARHGLGVTTPYRAKHPDVKFTILSRTSTEILAMLENLEVDAGLTYIDNEPLGPRARRAALREQYRLLTSADSPLGDRDR